MCVCLCVCVCVCVCTYVHWRKYVRTYVHMNVAGLPRQRRYVYTYIHVVCIFACLEIKIRNG